MTLETWVAFTLACIVLTLVPGPSVLLVVGQTLTNGKHATLMCIVGIMAGSALLMGLSFAGVGVILATSAALFQIVKWAGVIYLAYLGCIQILDAKRDGGGFEESASLRSSLGALWIGVVTAVLNPKAIIFYLAFFTQFIDPNGDISFQAATLMVTSTIVTGIFLCCYAYIASHARRMLTSKSAKKQVGYVGGSLMIFGSGLIAVTR
jgi:homoserine/homoserine lactone efflux protein